ncbi:MAG TPA: capsid cement protein, partial [Pirellulales bacterium]|nr:capsid cement protein [Pirellulales bacterium]
MATYVKGTQNHLDIVPVADAAAGDVVPIAECANLVAVYTRPYAAGAKGAAAYTGVFRFTTALED